MGKNPLKQNTYRWTRSQRWLSAFFAISVVSTSLGISNFAYAQSPREAVAHMKKGETEFKKKNYSEALKHFESAEASMSGISARYYIARCYEELGQTSEAASWYEKAIELSKEKPPKKKETKEQVVDAEERLSELKKKPVKVTITSEPAGAKVSVDNQMVATATPTELLLQPGKHKVVISHPDRKAYEQEINVAPFQPMPPIHGVLENAMVVPPKLDPFPPSSPADLTPMPEQPAPVATPKSSSQDNKKRDYTWAYIIGGTSIAALGLGTVFGIMALGNKSKFNREPSRDLRDSGTRNALIADVSFGIGITLLVTSAVLFFTTPGDNAEAPAANPRTAKTRSTPKTNFALSPWIGIPTSQGPSVAGASAVFQF